MRTPSPLPSKGTPVPHGDTQKSAEPVRALTAIRGIAAWWVVAYHFRDALPIRTPSVPLHFIAHGYLAVDLFFILSGYVIGLNYGAWFARGITRAGYAKFLALRLSRIYPLHVFMLVLFLANPIAIALFSNQGGDGDLRYDYYLLSYLLMQGWGLVPLATWNVPAWSISAEWLAYLVFPILAAGVFAATPTTRRAAVFLATLLAVTALATYQVSPEGLSYNGQLFGLMRCLTEFSAGLAIYRLEIHHQRSRTESNAALALAAVCFAAFALLPLPDLLFMPAGFACLIYALSDERGPIAQCLRIPPLQWLGAVSYSTYLSHYFIKDWVRFTLQTPHILPVVMFPTYVVAVLLASALLYRFVERPAQRWCRRRIFALASA